MISKNRLRYLKTLHQKKHRRTYQEFIIEGEKIVVETLKSDFHIKNLYCTSKFFNKHIRLIRTKNVDYEIANEEELIQAGTLISNEAALAVVRIPTFDAFEIKSDEYALVLDGVQDPGNLGTIIRIADWYGIEKLICSEDTVDIYNPKTLAATMASYLRVKVLYTDLVSFLEKQQNMPIYGAVLKGDNLHQVQFAKGGLLILGNESKGIREEIFPLIKQKISIPRFGWAESLNVGMAAAVICDNVRRSQL